MTATSRRTTMRFRLHRSKMFLNESRKCWMSDGNTFWWSRAEGKNSLWLLSRASDAATSRRGTYPITQSHFPTRPHWPWGSFFLLFLRCCCSCFRAISSYPRRVSESQPKSALSHRSWLRLGARPRVPVQADQSVPYTRAPPKTAVPFNCQEQVPGCRCQYTLVLFLENSTAPHGR